MVAAVNWAMAEKHLTVPNQIPCHKGMTATALKLGQSRTHVLFTYFLLEHNTERWWRGAEQYVSSPAFHFHHEHPHPWWLSCPIRAFPIALFFPLHFCTLPFQCNCSPLQNELFSIWLCALCTLFFIFTEGKKRSWTRTYWVLFIAKGRSQQQQVQNM